MRGDRAYPTKILYDYYVARCMHRPVVVYGVRDERRAESRKANERRRFQQVSRALHKK